MARFGLMTWSLMLAIHEQVIYSYSRLCIFSHYLVLATLQGNPSAGRVVPSRT